MSPDEWLSRQIKRIRRNPQSAIQTVALTIFTLGWAFGGNFYGPLSGSIAAFLIIVGWYFFDKPPPYRIYLNSSEAKKTDDGFAHTILEKNHLQKRNCIAKVSLETGEEVMTGINICPSTGDVTICTNKPIDLQVVILGG